MGPRQRQRKPNKEELVHLYSLAENNFMHMTCWDISSLFFKRTSSLLIILVQCRMVLVQHRSVCSTFQSQGGFHSQRSGGWYFNEK